jgi:hypothetical protein
VPQNRVHDTVVDDERDDPHLALTLRTHQWVNFIDTLDKLCPTSAESTGVRALIPVGSSRGGMLALARPSSDGDLGLSSTRSPRDVRVRPVVPDEVLAGLRNVHDHEREELGWVEGLDRIARLPGAAVGAKDYSMFHVLVLLIVLAGAIICYSIGYGSGIVIFIIIGILFEALFWIHSIFG